MYLHRMVHTYSIKDSFIKWLSHSGSGSVFQEGWLSNTGQVALVSREYSLENQQLQNEKDLLKLQQYQKEINIYLGRNDDEI